MVPNFDHRSMRGTGTIVAEDACLVNSPSLDVANASACLLSVTSDERNIARPGRRVPHPSRKFAELAKAAAPGKSTIPWDDWVADYSKIRDAIAATYPDIFHDFNARMWKPGGFHRPLAARERKWNTKTGKANFITPKSLASDIDTASEARDIVQLITLRSNGQFNTTIYSYDDRFRGIFGSRNVVLMHANDIDRFGLKEGSLVTLSTAVEDGVDRRVGGLRVVRYDLPEGCIAGYYPECNPLLPLWHHDEKSGTPAAKSIPVRVTADEPRIRTAADS